MEVLAGASAQAGKDVAVDVCIVGAGIIGLTAALTLLQADESVSVALLDRKEPCAGATGAGQGYIWMAHRDPTSAAWQLATRSKALWERLLDSDSCPAVSDAAVEWQPTGSALLATNAAEAETLTKREALLRAAGVDARYVDAEALRSAEPALHVGGAAAALFVPADSQLNGRQAAAAVLAACRAHGARFHTLFNEGCQVLVTGPSGRVEGVQTEARRVAAGRAVVLTSGAWAGEFLAQQLGAPGWAQALRPRRGHLLELRRPEGMPALRRGVMEVGYTAHYSAAGRQTAAGAAAGGAAPADITFTATTSASGTLLVGSSREFSGWEDVAQAQVVEAIMQRAAAFLPALEAVHPRDVSVRVGLRPFSPTGPLVGPVPGVEGLLLAAGHEGSGLTLGPATGELLAAYALGREHAVSAEVAASVLPKAPAAAAV